MNKLTFLFVLSSTIIIAFWSLVTPLFEFPDEQAHLGSVEFLAKHNRMPVGLEWDMTEEMRQTQRYLGVFRDRFGNNSLTYHPEFRLEYTSSLEGLYESQIKALNNPGDRNVYVTQEAARYPRLYYDYLNFWRSLVKDHDLIIRTFAMRLGGLALALATGLVVYQTGLLLFGSSLSARVLTLLVLLQPMYSFLSAGVNSDNLHNLLFATLLYLGTRITLTGLNLRLAIFSILTIVLDIATKPQGYLGIVIIALSILIHILYSAHWRKFFYLLLVAVVGSLAILHPANPYRSWIFTPNQTGASLIEFASFSLNKLVAQNIVWYWGVFKWLGVVLPPIYWQFANRLVVLAVIGLGFYAYRLRRKQSVVAKPAPASFLLLTSLIYALAIYYFDYQYVRAVGYSIGVQARYLFPTITAHMAILMIGLLSLTQSLKLQNLILKGLTIFIIWLQLGGLWRLITSYYDVDSLQTFITQASQYKPDFAKGEWWYLWIMLYLGSLIYLFWYIAIKSPDQTEPKAGVAALSSVVPQKYAPKKSRGSAALVGRLRKQKNQKVSS